MNVNKLKWKKGTFGYYANECKFYIYKERAIVGGGYRWTLVTNGTNEIFNTLREAKEKANELIS